MLGCLLQLLYPWSSDHDLYKDKRILFSVRHEIDTHTISSCNIKRQPQRLKFQFASLLRLKCLTENNSKTEITLANGFRRFQCVAVGKAEWCSSAHDRRSMRSKLKRVVQGAGSSKEPEPSLSLIICFWWQEHPVKVSTASQSNKQTLSTWAQGGHFRLNHNMDPRVSHHYEVKWIMVCVWSSTEGMSICVF